MSKNLTPQCKQCRRVGEKLFLKGEKCQTQKCPVVKRPYPPGIHGPKGKKRQTDYGLQLQEKQKAKKFYNVMEKQFKLTIDKAKKQAGDVGENLIRLLEMRLDNVIFRLGFASSHLEARQLVNHGHFTVNSKKVDIPSYQVEAGQVIKIKESSKRLKIFKDINEKVKKKQKPSWLNFDATDSSAKVLHRPKPEDMITNINTQMIVEYYSR